MFLEIIKIESLSKYYGKARGVTDISFSVNQGEFFGFIGPNGAGKSTTIRVLLGLIHGSYNKVEIFGKDIATHQQEILTDVGFMSSEGMFYNGMKVKDIIRLSADLRKKDCSAEAKRLCDILQLDTSRKIEELSLGNRKKVSIVCAMQHRPSLYIFDEPTSGLDPLIQHEFFTLLKQRNKEGATVFLSSHILSEIQRYCDRAAIIREGKIVALDNVDKLTKTKVRRITLIGSVDIDSLAGVSQVKRLNGSITFFYEGEINKLLSVLEKANLKDLMINEPDLEEVFMHYYQKEGEIL